MNRSLLLIFLISWSHVVPLSLQCETGIAHLGFALSVPHSLMYNADVAILKTYQAEDRNACMNECCTEKYGSCTVASFKNNVSEKNCEHFNCRPVKKCKYMSSKTTDSFSFSSSPNSPPIVPSGHSSKNKSSLLTVVDSSKTSKLNESARSDQEEHSVTKEAAAMYSEEQFGMQNDNVTIKPRKGVDEYEDFSSENVTRSGVKPRKGVSLENVSISNNSKSKVKPRKGVGPYEAETTSSPAANELSIHTVSSLSGIEHFSTSLSTKTHKDIMAQDLISALEKVFEDDTNVKDLKSTSSTTDFRVKSIDSAHVLISSAVQTSIIIPTETSSTVRASTSDLQSSIVTSYVVPTSVQTPHLHTAFIQSTETMSYTIKPPTTSPTIFEHSKLLFHEGTIEVKSTSGDNAESEKERRYKSSMHLVLSLVFGLLVLFAVMGVVAKRVYDSWMRRHYRRMDFLIDGMYNGYG